LAATVGVLGGVGGAFVGGCAANQGQAEGFKRERAAARQDLRTEVYGEYLGTAEAYVLSNALSLTEAEKGEWLVKLFVSRARVFLVRENIDVEKAAEAITAAVTDDEEEMAAREACGEDLACHLSLDEEQYNAYVEAGNTFLSRARQEIAETAE
jgi:hypothetical protein